MLTFAGRPQCLPYEPLRPIETLYDNDLMELGKKNANPSMVICYRKLKASNNSELCDWSGTSFSILSSILIWQTFMKFSLEVHTNHTTYTHTYMHGMEVQYKTI